MSPSTNPRSQMFYDWIKAYQDYSFDLPKVSKMFSRHFDAETGEQIAETTPAFLAIHRALIGWITCSALKRLMAV
jgi:hypothetical protein